MGQLSPRSVSYRPNEYRSPASSSYQGMPSRPANDPLRAKNPYVKKGRVSAAELASRRQARMTKDFARLSRQAAMLGRTVAAPGYGSLAGIAGKAFARFIPLIGIGLTVYELYEWYRQRQGVGAYWSMPSGWVQSISCSPSLAGSALRDVSRASWVHQCYIGQTVSNSYSTTHRHRILWGQSNGIGTLWSVLGSWQWPGALPNDNGVATWNPEVLPSYEPVDLPAVNPAIDPMSLPIMEPVPMPQPLPYRLLPYLRYNPYRVEQSERHNEVPGTPKPAPAPKPVPAPQPVPSPNAPPASTPGTPGAPRPPAGRLDPRIRQTRPTRKRPGRKTKERKVRDKLGLVRWALSQTTEAFDIVDALHRALPKDCRAKPVWDPDGVSPGRNPYGKNDALRDKKATNKWTDPDGVVHKVYGYGFTPRGVAQPLDKANQNLYRAPNPYEKAKAVYRCYERLNIGDALFYWAKAQLVDKAIGKLNRGAQRQGQRFNPNRPITWTGGPAL